MPDEPNIKKLILQSQYVVEEYEETKEKMDAVAEICVQLDNNANELVSEISKFKL